MLECELFVLILVKPVEPSISPVAKNKKVLSMCAYVTAMHNYPSITPKYIK